MEERLIKALRTYGFVRRRIGRVIQGGIEGLPQNTGRDILSRIDRMERQNVTGLGEALGMTRSGASKAVSRLSRAGLVETYQLPENRKEIYLRLSAAGTATLERLNAAFGDLHAYETAYLKGLPPGSKTVILDFLEGFTAHLRAYPVEVPNEHDDD